MRKHAPTRLNYVMCLTNMAWRVIYSSNTKLGFDGLLSTIMRRKYPNKPIYVSVCVSTYSIVEYLNELIYQQNN